MPIERECRTAVDTAERGATRALGVLKRRRMRLSALTLIELSLRHFFFEPGLSHLNANKPQTIPPNPLAFAKSWLIAAAVRLVLCMEAEPMSLHFRELD